MRQHWDKIPGDPPDWDYFEHADIKNKYLCMNNIHEAARKGNKDLLEIGRKLTRNQKRASLRAGGRAGGQASELAGGRASGWASGVGEWVAARGLLARTGVAVVGLTLPAAPAGRGGSAGESGAWRDEDQYQARRGKVLEERNEETCSVHGNYQDRRRINLPRRAYTVFRLF